MKNIGFLLQDVESQYEGVARPFINFAQEMQSNEDITVYFICLKCGKNFNQYIKSYGETICSNNINDLIGNIRETNFDFILTDDAYSRLVSLSKIKQKTNIKTGIYVQIFMGIHSIVNVFDLSYLSTKDKLLYNIIRYIPFSLFEFQFRNILKKNDIIISNSNITRVLLHILYDIESDGVVYPPVDTHTFKPIDSKKYKKVLIYLGSHAGDTNKHFLMDLCESVLQQDYDLLLFGNSKLGKMIMKKFQNGIKYISGVSDKELGEIYSECKLVICPQKWEQFGYVPVESMACGTPVLAFDIMGPSETIIDGKTGWLAKSEEEFINILYDILEKEMIDIIDSSTCKNHVINNFSSEASVKKLMEILEYSL